MLNKSLNVILGASFVSLILLGIVEYFSKYDLSFNSLNIISGITGIGILFAVMYFMYKIKLAK